MRAQDDQAAPVGLQLGLLLDELGGDDRHPVSKRGDLAFELRDLVVVLLDRGGENPGAVALLLQLRLLLIELGLEVLGGRVGAARQAGGDQEECQRRRGAGAARSRSCVVGCLCHGWR